MLSYLRLWSWLLSLMIGSTMASVALAKPSSKPIPFDCTNDARCGIRSDLAYEYQILGSFVKTASRTESDTIFKKLRTQGSWLFLPNDPKQFYDQNAIVSVAVDRPGFKPITVMIPRFEAEAGQFKQGDLVRYSPHLLGHEVPPVDTPLWRQYWSVTGCVMVLCRKGDAGCAKTYRPALYQYPSGKEVTFNHQIVADGWTVDPNNMRPIHPK
jgi:hypothetical protein